MAASTSSISFPNPSTIDPAFISIKLFKENYSSWQTQMSSFLHDQNLVGFVNGTISSKDHSDWESSNKRAKSWILGSLPESVLKTLEVLDTDTAEEIWIKLNNFGVETEYWKYLDLYKAAIRGDWPAAREFLNTEQGHGAISKKIVSFNDTALHIAFGAHKPIPFVTECVAIMSQDELAMRNNLGFTALCNAAVVGNTAAARLMVQKNRSLLYLEDDRGRLPLHVAAYYGQRETLEYLQNETLTGDDAHLFLNKKDLTARYLTYLITSGFFDLALEFAERGGEGFALKWESHDAPLLALVKVPNAFHSTWRLSFWANLFYKYVPTSSNSCCGKIFSCCSLFENLCSSTGCSPVMRFFYIVFRILLTITVVGYPFIFIVRYIKKIQRKKLFHHQALELVKFLCNAIRSSNDDEVHMRNTKEAVIEAARRGVHEVIEEIVDALPFLGWIEDDDNHFIFQMAVVNRCEKVFNLIFQMGRWKGCMLNYDGDKYNNNIMHMAAMLAPPDKLNLVSGAALQMQRELQWFKAVKQLLPRRNRENLNADGKTPRMVFTEQHKDLVIKGEGWMKDTARACTITAALITTIVFAAAISVPGGHDGSTGHPFFGKNNAYFVFAFADTISLSTSTISLFMFLAILTDRYSEKDFLTTLPTRLIFGLVFQFLSIISMLIAYSAIIFIMFDKGNVSSHIRIGLMLLPGLPILSFAFAQFPLLITVISSTYGRGIFVKQSNRPFLF